MSSDRFEFQLRALPWPKDSLQPFLSPEAITTHYDGHHQAYVNKMNNLAREFPNLQKYNLEEIVQRNVGIVRDIAAQIVNHNFFWKCLSSKGGLPNGNLYQLIKNQFGSYENFMKEFTNQSVDHFGSGWTWLLFDPSSKFLMILDGHDAYNPIIDGYIPLLVLDVWEHAYYVDYKNRKREYVENFWNFVNWDYVNTIANERIFYGVA